jgi:hypothetical protein
MYKPLCFVGAVLFVGTACSGNAPSGPSPVTPGGHVEIRTLEGGFRCADVELVEGQRVPPEVVQVGAVCDPASDGRAFGISTVKSCLNGKTLSNDTRGWWWQDGPYTVGRTPTEATDVCHYGSVRPPTTTTTLPPRT